MRSLSVGTAWGSDLTGACTNYSTRRLLWIVCVAQHKQMVCPIARYSCEPFWAQRKSAVYVRSLVPLPRRAFARGLPSARLRLRSDRSATRRSA